MKLFILLFFFVTTQTFAQSFNICNLQDTGELDDLVDQSHALIRETNDYFSLIEKNMITVTMKLDSWRSVRNQDEAVLMFQDRNHMRERPGSNAGEIQYYSLIGKTYALVHFWPGDNEYGAIFEMVTKTKFKLIALIGDGEISCRN